MHTVGECIDPVSSAVECLAQADGPPVAVGLDLADPPTVYMVELGARRGVESFVGFTAPPGWHSFGFVMCGRSAASPMRVVMATRCGLVFESGEVASIEITAAGSARRSDPRPTQTEVILARDVALRVLGLATPQSPVPAPRIAEALMLDWQLVAALDPAARQPPAHFELPDDFPSLREWISRHRPPGAGALGVNTELATWFDDGALARRIWTALPETQVLRRALEYLGLEPCVSAHPATPPEDQVG